MRIELLMTKIAPVRFGLVCSTRLPSPVALTPSPNSLDVATDAGRLPHARSAGRCPARVSDQALDASRCSTMAARQIATKGTNTSSTPSAMELARGTLEPELQGAVIR